MEKVKSPLGKVFIHLTLIVFSIYSLIPFYWTLLQSFKNLKDANSRTPKFFFSPTWDNYTDLWLRSVPENGAQIAFFLILAIVILICLLLFAEHIPLPNGLIYGVVFLGFAGILWLIPPPHGNSKILRLLHQHHYCYGRHGGRIH